MADMKTDYRLINTVVVTQEPVYTLTLNKDEAQALRAIVGYVSGSAFNTPRKHTDSIWSALQPAGTSEKWNVSGSLRFVEQPGL